MAYDSARDMPSFVELQQQLTGLKVLALVWRSKRRMVADLESQLKYLADTVDRFYDLLGDRHWIFHDDLNLDRMAAILDTAAGPDAAERDLIAYYQEPETLKFMVSRLNRFDAMRKRMPMVERGLDDYRDGRFYSATLVLLTVMDGFVNEFEKVRRGLHARGEEEMNALDSVVGHHKGLTHAHSTFTRSRGATNTDPVYELYRNGIIHGTVTNFDNDVVATKAWNRLFAVADWARAREKQQEPPQQAASWKEVIRGLAKNAEDKKALAAWRPRTVTPADDGFRDEDAYILSNRFLEAWQRRNFGGMVQYLSQLVRDGSDRGMAGEVRELYADHLLSEYRINQLDFVAAAHCRISAEIVVNGDPRAVVLRWIREDEGGRPVIDGRPGGEWRLILWSPHALADGTEADPA